tara:strand:- start:21 stop:530 length:510 start_codon:yes stop_codon:yes gene_type:complete
MVDQQEAKIKNLQDKPFINVDRFDFDQYELELNLESNTSNDIKLGLYQIKNESGAVADPLTGQLLYPGSEGYEAAARDSNNLVAELSTKENNLSTSSADSDENTAEIKRLALFVENESTGETFFSFNEANMEGKEYFQGLGNGTIGIKDEFNNEDFDDLLISFDVNPLF